MTARDAAVDGGIFDSPDGRTYSGPVTAATPSPAPPADVNDLPVTPAAAVLYDLCSGWTREAFRLPWMLGEKDPRARVLEDCSGALRDAVNGLRRDGAL